MPFYALLVLLGVMFNAANANAALCVEDNTTKCKQLGYTESSCKYGGVACLYDKSLWYCATWSCSDGRYSSSSLTNHDCLEVSYKGLTCYDCQPKFVCADGTYETEELCVANTNKTCVINSEGCYAPKTSNCPSGQYESSEECIAENKSAKKCEQDNATKCYKPVFSKLCPIGEYETMDECKKQLGVRICKYNDKTGCYFSGLTPADTCIDYDLKQSECPSNAKCDYCPTDNTKWKFTECNSGFYNIGTELNPICTSCSSAKYNMTELNGIATRSFLNCCYDSSQVTAKECRGTTYNTSGCLNTGRFGSWDDGCLPIYLQSIDTTYPDLDAYKNACKEGMQQIADKINAFNEACPNYKVNNVFSPTTQCASIVLNQSLAVPQYSGTEVKIGCPANSN